MERKPDILVVEDSVAARTETNLLTNICHIIVEFGGFELASVGFLRKNGDIVPEVAIGKHNDVIGPVPTVSPVPRGHPAYEAIDTRKPTNGTAEGLASERQEQTYPVIALPLIEDEMTYGALIIQKGREETFSTKEITLLMNLSGDMAYEITGLRMRQEWTGALQQIEHNIEQLAILSDQIRNPLAVIVGIASMMEDSQTEEIIRQAREIDLLVTKLDRRWLESAKVREFLRKHENFVYHKEPE